MDVARNTCLAVLLAALSAPAAPAGSVAMNVSPTQSGRVRHVARSASIRRRVERPRKFPDISPATVFGASEYLRSRSTDRTATPAATQAWDQFYRECDPVIRRFASAFRRRGIDVEECVQDTWADLVRSLRQFSLDQNRGRFTSWLYSIVRNKAADQIRRSLRRPALSLSDAASALPSIDADPARRLIRADELRALRDGLRRLRTRISAISYSVLHLRHLEGRSVRETADALGLSSQQVWTREHRVKERLRQVLMARSTDSAFPSRRGFFAQGLSVADEV